MAAVEHFKAHPGAWGIGLLYKVLEHLRPEKRVQWPDPSPEFVKARAAEQKRQKESAADLEKRQAKAKQMLEQRASKELEDAFGPMVDAMSLDEVREIITGEYPHLVRMLPKEWPHKGVIRQTLLTHTKKSREAATSVFEAPTC